MIVKVPLLAFLFSLVMTFATGAHDVSQKTVANASGSIVSLLPQQLSKKQLRDEPEGTGFFVGDGSVILTAAHVLGKSIDVLVRTSEGKVFNTNVIARDEETDLALLRSPVKMRPLNFARSVTPTQPVCAIGNGFGLGLSASCGIVSAIDRSGIGFNAIEDFVQTDAAVNPGMSGGPLINENGEAVGVLSAIFTKDSDANIGVNFAVSSRLATAVINDLLDNGKIDRQSSGLLLKQGKGENETGLIGALVNVVKPGSPEEIAGVKPGDLVLAVSGARLIKAAAYKSIVARLSPPFDLTLLVFRDGKTLKLQVNFPQ